MDILDTWEVRWFRRGRCPFAADEVLPDGEFDGRCDLYAPGDTRSSIKLREGMLQVKTQIDTRRWLRWGRFGGHLTRHRKWTMPWPGGGEDRHLLRRQGWLAVEKSRTVARSRHDGIACEIELAELTIHAHPWWSFCLEISGSDVPPQELVGQQLHAHAKGLLAQYCDPDWSMGYAAWLSGFGHRSRADSSAGSPAESRA
jgi:hypothetical protein